MMKAYKYTKMNSFTDILQEFAKLLTNIVFLFE